MHAGQADSIRVDFRVLPEVAEFQVIEVALVLEAHLGRLGGQPIAYVAQNGHVAHLVRVGVHPT